ncbi:MAG: DUF6261 family protein [Tannerellaceae bacterium]|jgi:hypothetical protein|nr:DUF6261 family protein [Tannerellaceae bacterium]
MKKLISIRFKKLLSKLHNGEHFDFYSRGIIAGLEAIIVRFQELNEIFLSLKSAFQLEDKIFKKNEASILTPDIARMVEMLTAYFSYFKHSIDIVRFSTNPVELQAMTTLQFLVKMFVRIPKVDYPEMSGLLDSFLESCDSPTYKPAVELLGLSSQVNRMKAVYSSYRSLYNARSLSKEQVAELGKLRYVRAEIDDVFATLVDGVNVACTVNELGSQDPDQQSALLEIKEVIVGELHQMELNVAHRRKLRKGAKAKLDEAAATDN